MILLFSPSSGAPRSGASRQHGMQKEPRPGGGLLTGFRRSAGFWGPTRHVLEGLQEMLRGGFLVPLGQSDLKSGWASGFRSRRS
jgi:hypothetical protein